MRLNVQPLRRPHDGPTIRRSIAEGDRRRFGCRNWGRAAGVWHRKYIACPQAGIEILLPDGFVPTTEPEGYLNAETGANVLVVVSDNPIEVEIAGLTHGDFGRNGIEIVEKTPLTLAGKRAILVSTQQTGANPNAGIVDPTSIAQWIVGFGDRSTVLVVASYPLGMKDQYSALFKRVVLSARPIQPAGVEPQRMSLGRGSSVSADGANAKGSHGRRRSERSAANRRGSSSKRLKPQSNPIAKSQANVRSERTPPTGMRIWASLDGKFTVAARLKSFDGAEALTREERWQDNSRAG